MSLAKHYQRVSTVKDRHVNRHQFTQGSSVWKYRVLCWGQATLEGLLLGQPESLLEKRVGFVYHMPGWFPKGSIV